MPIVSIISYATEEVLGDFRADHIRLSQDSLFITIANDQDRQEAHRKLIDHDFDAYVERPKPLEIWVDDYPEGVFLQIE